ncbi:MAG TPA: adenylate/guanylate cyclase domain-containing protein, partial [Spirochaetes bacterium]|nr:adenylate/guanylate cyclase domain-containing protein [Spirochaetota bacterium]
HITILFSDIRNFTATCENLDAEKVVSNLNEYFAHMVDVIFDHGGTVNKFVGDMIVALFGAPTQMKDSEKRAIETAIKMQQCLKTMSNLWIRGNFHTGIGINSGEMVVGNIGSPRHMDYTAIGDEANIASRLQALAKPGQILVSKSIYETTKDDFKFNSLGFTKVKGKEKDIELFEVLYQTAKKTDR